jgi:hypothetical protein
MRTLLLTLALAALALANIDPRALEQRSRLGFLLSNETRARADRVAAELSLTDVPALLETRLQEALGHAGQSEPARLYAAVDFLKRREQALDAYDARMVATLRGQELLEDYLDRALVQGRVGPSGEPLPAPAPPPWAVEQTADALKVARWLPYPTTEMSHGRVEQLRAAARADLETAYLEWDRVEKARETYKLESLVWVDYVYGLTIKVSAMKDPQILALPGANPHPPPTF